MLSITTKIMVPGYHYWSDAPVEVSFLRHVHRHLFTFEAEVQVDFDDREVEFFQLQEHMRFLIERHGYFGPLLLSNTGTQHSCEAMAVTMASGLQRRGCNVLRVSVSEDGESSGSWRPD